jgi:bifunctional NMN adenylyltransferase/nudix hydrolase
MSKKYDYCVFIGRMQPPHKSHIRAIQQALSLADQVIIIFGSHRAARNIKNPFTAKEREEMVKCCFNKDDVSRIHFTCVRDYYYNDNNWVADVQQKVFNITDEGKRIVLLGRYKDHSSYYLDLFPQWKREEVTPTNELLNATDVRNIYFQPAYFDKLVFDDSVSQLETGVLDYLKYWKNHNKELYQKLCEEWKFIQEYKAMWAQAPYPVTFVTTDAVVVKSGHVLMVRRRANPGRGLLALPGGFLQQNVKIVDSALKELKEETRIRIPKEELMKHLKDEKVFDHPNRSLRGRTITHAYYFELPAGGELPHVKGDDDAEHAVWIPITELYARDDEVYEDHLHIVNYFYGKSR